MVARWQAKVFPVAGARSLIRLPNGSLITASSRRFQEGEAIYCICSADKGRNWRDRGKIATDGEPGTDMGDRTLLRTRGGTLLYAYRHNHYRGKYEKTLDYAVRLAVSLDDGVNVSGSRARASGASRPW